MDPTNREEPSRGGDEPVTDTPVRALPLSMGTSVCSDMSSVTTIPEMYHDRALYPRLSDEEEAALKEVAEEEDDDATAATASQTAGSCLDDLQSQYGEKLRAAEHIEEEKDCEKCVQSTESEDRKTPCSTSRNRSSFQPRNERSNSNSNSSNDLFASIRDSIQELPTENSNDNSDNKDGNYGRCSVPGAYAEVNGHRQRLPVAHMDSSCNPGYVQVGAMSWSNGNDQSNNNDDDSALVRAELAPDNFEEIVAERDALRQTVNSIQEATAIVLVEEENSSTHSSMGSNSKDRRNSVLTRQRRRRHCILWTIVVGIGIVALAVVLGVVLTLDSDDGVPLVNTNEQIKHNITSENNKNASTTATTAPTVASFWESRMIGQTLYGTEEFGEFGEFVALSSDGTILAVGGEEQADFAGQVHVFKLQPQQQEWHQMLAVKGDEEGEESARLALSSDANMLAVGGIRAPGEQGEEQAGKVRTFSLETVMELQRKEGTNLDTIPQVLLGRHSMHRFGGDVQLSADGTIMAVGSIGSRKNFTEFGSVQVYKLNTTTNKWNTLGQELFGDNETDFFGCYTALSENGLILAAGAYGADHNGDRSGLVRVYQFNQELSLWEQRGQTFYGEEENDEIGRSISLSSDGRVIAFGGYDHNDSTGRVYVYKWSNESSGWHQMGQSIDGYNHGDRLGRSVALSGDGQVLAAGAFWNNATGERAGHVRVFYWNNTSNDYWDQVGPPISGSALDWFGRQIAMSRNGKALAIGGPMHSSRAYAAGKVEVYSLS